MLKFIQKRRMILPIILSILIVIIINNLGYLKYKNLKFRCSLGKAGVGVKKREGDNITPKGTFKIIKIHYRKDKRMYYEKKRLSEGTQSGALCNHRSDL